MILAFSTHFPKDKGSLSGKETLFPHKIWKAILSNDIIVFREDYSHQIIPDHYALFAEQFGSLSKMALLPKLHTIRGNKKGKYKKDCKLHPSVFVRTKEQFQFAPTIRCISTQKLEISYRHGQMYISVDDRFLDFKEAVLLAKNDGFDSLTDFLLYFDDDFTGEIIHWTPLKY